MAWIPDQTRKVIVACSTPPGSGAIALIRLSGEGVLDVIQACWKGRDLSLLEPRCARLGYIIDACGEIIDQVVLTHFPAPGSYTGEDSIEVSAHGSPLIVRLLIDRFVACGAAPAEPGEFTRRAFLNGRMDLTQAEAVMDILNAESRMSLRAAQDQLAGALGTRVRELMDGLLHVLAHIEAYIDFPEEDINPDALDSMILSLQEARQELVKLSRTADQGRFLREGIRVVLVGAPNAGKSSLLNALLGYDRAIVSEVEGTTRDTIEEAMNIGGYTLRLIDTAGLREAGDKIEQMGMERTHAAVGRADWVLEICDATLPPEACLTQLQRDADSAREEGEDAENFAPQRLRVLNKADKGIHPKWKEQEKSEEKEPLLSEVPSRIVASRSIAVSCLTGQGLEDLVKTLEEIVSLSPALDKSGHLIAVNARHKRALEEAELALGRAVDCLNVEASPEFVALELREALAYLGDIVGSVDIEDLLGIIFTSFCLGK